MSPRPDANFLTTPSVPALSPIPPDLEKIRSVVASVLGDETLLTSVGPDTDLPALGLDSIKVVDLLLAVEDAFDIRFPDSALTAATFRTPSALHAAVAALL